MDYPEIPGYIIKSRLGKGGMATIFLAEQTIFRRLVALKVMLPQLSSDPSFAERFMREARNVAQMSHPNFVPVYDVGQHDGNYYMSMEYLPTGDLKSHMRKGLALRDGVRIIKEVAGALNYADQKNFVHRDIKPENILLRENLSAVVCDFGIAKEISEVSQMTLLGTIVGTPRYMSPEQAQAAQLDGRSDLYSLGIIFFEMLAGQVPYDGGSSLDIAIKHVNEPIPKLPMSMAAFQPFIEVALAKRPEYRFQTGRDMIHALEELEEANYSLIQENSITVLVSQDDLHLSSHRPRTGASRHSSWSSRSGSGAGSRSSTPSRKVRPSRKGHADVVFTWGKVTAMSVAAIVVASGVGWWFYAGRDAQGLISNSKSAVAAPAANFGGIARGLLEKAESALDDGRLYGSGDDNAQSYLTALLILAPDDSGGKASITRLYGMYLEAVSVALEKGDLAAAQETLNQAGKISYYIHDDDLIEQQSELQRTLMSSQEQAKINAERDARIGKLLAEAEEFRDNDKLTSPVDENAYSRYQEVLSLAPSNEIASKGIEQIAGAFLMQAREQLGNGQVGRASAFLAAAVQIYPQHPDMASVREAVRSEEKRLQEMDSQQQVQRTEVQQLELSKRAEQRRILAHKVQSLLGGASEDIKAGRLSSPEKNNAMEKYKEVLDIYPASVEALTGLEEVADRHIAIALGMIKGGQLEDAEWNLARAKSLSPINPKYSAAQSELIALKDQVQQKAAAESARKEKIASLFAAAELAAKKGNIYQPADNNALQILRQIFELDRQYKPALALRDELDNKIQSNAADYIKSRRFADARLAIDALVSSRASDEKVAVLRKQLKNQEDVVVGEAARASRQEQETRDKADRERIAQDKAAMDKASMAKTSQQREEEQRKTKLVEQQESVTRASEIQKMLTQAVALGGPERVTQENYRQLAELYGKIRNLEPANATARQGISLVSDYVIKRAESAISARDLRSAEDLAAYLGDTIPDSPSGKRLLEDIAIKQRQQAQATEILAAADVLIATATLGNNDKTLLALQAAFTKIQSARAVDATNPAVAASEQKLVRKYTDIIGVHLNANDLDDARAVLGDWAGTGLQSAQLASIQQQIDRLEKEAKTKERPVVGGF